MNEQDVSAAFAGISTVAVVIYLAIIIFMIVAEWKLFEKAGQPGWAILVPIYSTIVFLKIVQRPIAWIFLFFIPLVNFIIAIIMMLDLAKVYGKDSGFGIGLIFLPIIFIPILAFGDTQYQGKDINYS